MDNNLVGVIPKEIGNFAGLRVLNLGGNLIKGCVFDAIMILI